MQTNASGTELTIDNLWRFSVDEYHRMIGARILGEDDPVELLEGLLVQQLPRGPRHDTTLCYITDVLWKLREDQWLTRVRSGMTTDDSEPEPDIVLAKGPSDRYETRHPMPGDVALVVEIAAASLMRDRELKGRIYARAGVPTYWIINLPDSVCEVYTDPPGPHRNPSYRSAVVYRPGDTIPLTLLDGTMIHVAVRDLFPGSSHRQLNHREGKP